MFHATEHDCYELVKFFDSDEDGKLSYGDFIQMVLPCEDQYLRKVTQDRAPFRVGRWDYLPRDIEMELVRLIECELHLMKRLEVQKQELEYRHDYSVVGAFRTIDRYNEGSLNTFNIDNWLKQNNHFASEREIIALIRRMDTDGDCKVSFEEFSDMIQSHSRRFHE